MVDRVYKSDIPEKRKALERLKTEFSKVDPKTDWTKLRVEPLLRHVKELERQLKSQSSRRLTRGVRMFHSDLVYLRDNVRELEQILESERKGRRPKGKTSAR